MDLASVVPDHSIDAHFVRTQPGDATTVAKPDDTYWTVSTHVVGGRSDIDGCRHPVDLLAHREARLHSLVGVVEIDAALGSIEQCRRNREVAQLGVAVDDGTDVCVHAEDLLHYNDRRWGIRVARNVSGKHMPVGGGHLDEHTGLVAHTNNRSSYSTRESTSASPSVMSTMSSMRTPPPPRTPGTHTSGSTAKTMFGLNSTAVAPGKVSPM